MKHCVIIGAGISGVIAAQRLKKSGWQVTLLEKSAGYGGRMATRRVGEAICDHGAQFFTMHSMFFRVLVEEMQDAQVVGQWSRGFLNGERKLALDGYLRFYGLQGMNQVVRYLAEGLDVRLQEKVIGFSQVGDTWHIQCESGLQLGADALIVTAPLPQSLQLLKQANGLTPDPKLWEKLETIKYDPCIAILVTLDGPSGLPEPGGLAQTDPMSPIQWIADNRRKGISPVDSVTVHGTAHFSRQHWKIDREAAGEKLWEAVQPLLSAQRIEMQTHGWRFAQPKQVLEANSATLSTAPPLLLAGDAFGDRLNPIEGAALSGLDAAKALLALRT